MGLFPIQDFMDRQIKKLTEDSSPYQAKSNNVSALGHPCVRYLVYKRTRGYEAIPMEPDKMASVHEGHPQEDNAVKIIRDFGYDYIRGQEAIEIPDLQISGRIDGVTVETKNRKVIGRWASEIKSVQPMVFEKMNNADDLKNSAWYYRKWIVQLNLAIFHVSKVENFDDTGIFWMKDKTRFWIKPIAIQMDWDILDEAFNKAKTVNQCMAANTLPDRLSYTEGICYGCEFRHICQPEQVFQAGEKIDDEEFLKKLRIRDNLKPGHSEYTRIDKEIKAVLKHKDYAVCGEFRITGKKNVRGWTTTIEKLYGEELEEALNVI